jgi:UDP-3-O-[3-hydroxymyristoyl] glucosamine N-acyltransferase
MARELKSPISVGYLAAELGLEVFGDLDSLIFRVDSVGSDSMGSLCFAKNIGWSNKASEHSVLITSEDSILDRSGPTIFSHQPRLDFARALNLIDFSVGYVWSSSQPMIHPTAIIGQNVILGKGVRVGAGTVVHHNVVIGDEVIIGERCIIKSGAIIGEEGFGFERNIHGKAVRLPHLGAVLIDDDVEVGSLTTVCRGTLGDTVLRKGCKIDDHVHIAHNVDVGEDAFVIACAEISGGVKIGPSAWIAPNVSVLNQVSIGANSVIGLGSVVIKSVPNDAVVVGNPAKLLSRS